MTTHNRPLSPHLQVYRLPLTGLISISHRITGVLLCFGLILIIAMLFAIAAGESSYLAMQSFMSNGFCELVFWGFIYALYFHVCHGVRHLLWDTVHSFEAAKLDLFAMYELIASALLLLLTIFLL